MLSNVEILLITKIGAQYSFSLARWRNYDKNAHFYAQAAGLKIEMMVVTYTYGVFCLFLFLVAAIGKLISKCS